MAWSKGRSSNDGRLGDIYDTVFFRLGYMTLMTILPL